MGQKLLLPQGHCLTRNDLQAGGDWEDSIDLLRCCAEAVDAGKLPISALDELRDIIDQRYQNDRYESAGSQRRELARLPVEVTYLS